MRAVLRWPAVTGVLVNSCLEAAIKPDEENKQKIFETQTSQYSYSHIFGLPVVIPLNFGYWALTYQWLNSSDLSYGKVIQFFTVLLYV